MKSVVAPRFWKLLNALPSEVQLLARKNHRLWREDSRHPSLRFRRLEDRGDLYTVRVGEHYRALGSLDGDTITWVWIGSHAEYDRLTSSK